MNNLPTANTKPASNCRAKLLFAAALLFTACCGPTGQCAESIEASIAAAEKSLFEGRFNTALEQYRNLLNSILSEKTPLQEKQKWLPEVDLALRRMVNLNQRLERSAEIAPLLAAWSRKLSELEPIVSALATYGAAWLTLNATGSIAEAQRHWDSLGQLGK
ncbi:MAG: hypothetical protein VX288_00505, partial [Planctomycetota bacterium]|nr:hypothetical protein [Planctomycetota bacterium]